MFGILRLDLSKNQSLVCLCAHNHVSFNLEIVFFIVWRSPAVECIGKDPVQRRSNFVYEVHRNLLPFGSHGSVEAHQQISVNQHPMHRNNTAVNDNELLLLGAWGLMKQIDTSQNSQAKFLIHSVYFRVN